MYRSPWMRSLTQHNTVSEIYQTSRLTEHPPFAASEVVPPKYFMKASVPKPLIRRVSGSRITRITE